MKVIVTGASGMLGTALIDRLADDFTVIATSRQTGYQKSNVEWTKSDLLDSHAFRSWLIKKRPDVVIHCAALVDVDYCERNPTLAEDIHVRSTQTIISVLKDYGGRIIYISTDSVFNGKKDGLYTEKDIPKPINIYAKTKLAGEEIALSYSQAVVLRTNIFGWSWSGKLSFAEWILSGLKTNTVLNMFNDVYYTPISVFNLSDIIAEILYKEIFKGLYHASGSTSLSKYDFAIRMASIFNLNADNIFSKSIEKAELLALRPKNMALSNKYIQSFLSYDIPTIEEGIFLMKRYYESNWVDTIRGDLS